MTDNDLNKARIEQLKTSTEAKISIQFSNDVIELMKADGLTLFEALLESCRMHDIDPDDVKGLLTPKLITMLTAEAEERFMIKPSKKSERLF